VFFADKMSENTEKTNVYFRRLVKGPLRVSSRNDNSNENVQLQEVNKTAAKKKCSTLILYWHQILRMIHNL